MSKQYPGGIISKTPVTPSGPYETSTASGIWTLDQQAYWRKLNQWPIAGSVQPDPQFNYVTMLLHGDGTNGAQNNTFLDSSGNSLSIIRVGNVTQGSFSPYGSNWSNYFGTGNYLTFSSSISLSSSFTVECWFNLASAQASFQMLTGESLAGSGEYISIISSGIEAQFGASGPTTSTITYTFAVGTWYHFALVRNGTTVSIYINGVAQSVTNSTQSATMVLQYVGVGYDSAYVFPGYISNFRINTTAVYTSAFTPSTTPLTAISGTSLLTCQSNRFIDNSASPKTITVNGNTSVQRFNPFGTATAYSTSVIGGSGYFDGTGDYLNVGNNTVLRAGTGDFTFESWVYSNGVAGSEFIADFGSSNVNGWGLYDEGAGGNLQFRIADVDRIAVAPLVARAWSHVAIVRSGTTATLYVNGISVGSYGSAGTNLDYTGNSYIGTQVGSNIMNGYLSDVRLVKGTAVYTSNFTPPTAPLTAITNTSLLLSMTNGAIFDNAMMNDLETVGNAQISTSVVKYGTGSMYFDGTGDAIYSTSQATTFGTGDFTLEFWIYFNAVNNSTVKFIYDMRNSGATSASFLAQEAGNTWTYWNGAGTSISSGFTSSTFTASTWTHVAICRSSGTTRFFAGGTLANSAADTSNYANSTLTFGSRYSYSDALNAYIDDLRITKGYARYTASFTPPTAAFFNYGPT